MDYADGIAQLNDRRMQIYRLREEIRALQAEIAPEPVADHAFETLAGPTTLSALFGDKDQLIVIHNMGAGCLYCTLWADGFNGVAAHLGDRAGFVVISPDAPSDQARLAEARGWRFAMASDPGARFAEAMGFAEAGASHPGISTFAKTAGGLQRVSHAPMGPGDDYNVVWHIFDMLPGAAAGWEPKARYS